MTLFTHWREAEGVWRWPSFSPAEIASHDAARVKGPLLLDEAAMDRLQALRDALGKPMIVNSAYRSPAHNARVGGAKASMHLLGRAFDIAMTNHDPHRFEAAARACGFNGIGIYGAQNFIHIDTRETPARWVKGGEFPDSGAGFTAPPPPDRRRAEKAARDAVVISAGGVVVQEALREAAPLLGAPWSDYVMLAAVAVGAAAALWRLTRPTSAEPAP